MRHLFLRFSLVLALILTSSAVPVVQPSSVKASTAFASPNVCSPLPDFNIFVFGDLTLTGNDPEGRNTIDGRVAIGGVARITKYDLGVSLQLSNSNGTRDDLIVGGNLNFTNGSVQKGNIVYGGTGTLSTVSIPNGTARQGTPLSFSTTEADLQAKSTFWGSVSATSPTSVVYTGPTARITLTGNNASINVFTVSGADLSAANSLTINVPAGATALINVNGSVNRMSNLSFSLTGGATRAKTLFNFYQTGSLTLENSAIEGTILAPYAAVAFNSGIVYGSLIADSVTGAGQTSDPPFTGCTPDQPTPTPTRTRTATVTNTRTATATASRTSTNTATATTTRTSTGTRTATLSPTRTNTPSRTATLAPTPIPCGTGTILRQVWNNVTGSAVNDLEAEVDFPNYPDVTTFPTSFEAPQNFGDNYGTYLRGYICTRTAGQYTFWIASDDDSELYISTNNQPTNKVLRASVTGFAGYQEWDKYASQESIALTLAANTQYYVEVLHKEGAGGDHVEVAWEGPGIVREIVEGAYLSPFVPPTVPTRTPTRTATRTATPTATTTPSITPTPSRTNTATRTGTATNTRTATLTSTRTNTPTRSATPVPCAGTTSLTSWSAFDVGGATTGTSTQTGSQVFICGSGDDIWGTFDQLRYVYTSATGNVDIKARIIYWDGSVNDWSKAGLMIRNSTDANAAHGSILITGNNGEHMQWRLADGDVSNGSGGDPFTIPVWVRLVKTGDTIASYVSNDGTTWGTPISTQVVELNPTFLVGMGVTSHSDGLFARATFDNISIVQLPTATATASSTSTNTPTNTRTSTVTNTPSRTPTRTNTNTPTITNTPSQTRTSTATSTPRPLNEQGCPSGQSQGSNLVFNGNFQTLAGPGPGVSPAAGFTSELPNRGNQVYPDDAGLNGTSSFQGGFSILSGMPNTDGGRLSVQPFSGDTGVGGPFNYLQANPNDDLNGTAGAFPGLVWRQQVNGLAPNTLYNFKAYFDNLLLLGDSGVDPFIELRVNSTVISTRYRIGQLPDRWVPVQFSFVTGPAQTSAQLEIYDVTRAVYPPTGTPSFTQGNEYAITAVGLYRCVPSSPTPTQTFTPTATNTPEPCRARVMDIVYLLDISGSMGEAYPGAGTKLDAAKQAIITTNNKVAAFNNGSRASLVTFYGASAGSGTKPQYGVTIAVNQPLTVTMAAVNSALSFVTPFGSTPTTHGLNAAVDQLLSVYDGERTPVVILISDGVATISHEGSRLWGYGFADGDVQDVSVLNPDNPTNDPDLVFLPSADVRQLGQYYSLYDMYAGEPLADLMDSTDAAKEAMPIAMLHAIAVQSQSTGIFNDSVLRYVAYRGDGIFANPNSTAALEASLAAAVDNSACGTVGGPTPTPAPATPTPFPTACAQPRSLDVYYLLDISASMDESYPGSGNKLDAAKQAIINTNAYLSSLASNSQAGLMTYTGSDTSIGGSPPLNSVSTVQRQALTSNLSLVNQALTSITATGSTPSAHGLRAAALKLLETYSGARIPVIILVTDGVATISYEQTLANPTGTGYFFSTSAVQAVNVTNPDGSFRSVAEVRSSGQYFAQYDKYAGETLADLMEAAIFAKQSMPPMSIHTIAVQSVENGIFNDTSLRYVAAFGNGVFANANDTDALLSSLANAIQTSACQPTPTRTITP